MSTERELFESWALSNGHSIECPEGPGIYYYTYARDAWVVWQARAAMDSRGDVVVTRDSWGEIVAVTRQDSEGRIFSVIAEKFTAQEEHDHWIKVSRIHAAIKKEKGE